MRVSSRLCVCLSPPLRLIASLENVTIDPRRRSVLRRCSNSGLSREIKNEGSRKTVNETQPTSVRRLRGVGDTSATRTY